jgi:hypothetical protein
MRPLFPTPSIFINNVCTLSRPLKPRDMTQMNSMRGEVLHKKANEDILRKSILEVENVEHEPTQIRFRSVHWQRKYVYCSDSNSNLVPFKSNRKQVFVWRGAQNDETFSKARFYVNVVAPSPPADSAIRPSVPPLSAM